MRLFKRRESTALSERKHKNSKFEWYHTRGGVPAHVGTHTGEPNYFNARTALKTSIENGSINLYLRLWLLKWPLVTNRDSNVTRIKFLARVNLFMPSQTVFIRKPKLANVTRKRFLTSVNSSVNN